MGKKVLCGYGVDVDAVAGWINTHTSGHCADPTNVSRGVFGATEGLDRVLKLFKKYSIKGSFYIPAHTVESFPEQIAKIRDAGHEIGLHGYTHELVTDLTEQQERDVLAKSIDVVTKFTGKKPRGWTAPAWTISAITVPLLEEHGIIYDHSMMYHDCQPYYLPYNPTWTETNFKIAAQEWMKPMTALKSSSIVEIPASWHLDDWPPLNLGFFNQGFVDPWLVEKLWKEQFDYFYREYDTFIFPMSLHPQVSGKPQVQLMHERLIEYINTHEGVEWVPFEEMAAQFKAGKLGPGVTVKGGVEV